MRYESKDFKGLTPSVDVRKLEDLYVLSGRNYVLDVFGPKSAFGNRFLTPYPVGKSAHWQSCRLRLRTEVGGADRVFVFMADGIYEWREDLGGWRVIYITPDTSVSPYRWSYGYLNGIMFFCHPIVGILAYDIDADLCEPLVGPGVPTQAIGLAVNNGRLIVFDDVNYYFSAPGDGTDFNPRLGGAGFQVISAVVAGFPICVYGYAGGTILFTTGGVMRSEFTGDSFVYRHRPLNTEFRPMNSFCALQLDDNTVAFLDERGLFQTRGEAPTPMTPLFNEFLIDYLQKYNLKVGQNVRLEWDELKRYMYLSVSLSQSNPIYEKAFVLYPAIDKWGTFDENHYGIGPLLIQDSSRGDDYFGFVDESGRVRYWDYVGSREILPLAPTLNSYYPLIQTPAAKSPTGGGVVLGSSMTVNTFDDSLITSPAGYYPNDGTNPAPAELTDLDAVIQLGLIRDRENNSLDRMIEISALFIGNVLSGEADQAGEDFNLIPDGTSDEDYNAEVGSEDFGYEVMNYINHGLRVIGTLDGHSLFLDEVPSLVQFNQAGRYFSCSVTGLWAIVELSATQVGEAFHVKVLELTAVDAGVLN